MAQKIKVGFAIDADTSDLMKKLEKMYAVIEKSKMPYSDKTSVKAAKDRIGEVIKNTQKLLEKEKVGGEIFNLNEQMPVLEKNLEKVTNAFANATETGLTEGIDKAKKELEAWIKKFDQDTKTKIKTEKQAFAKTGTSFEDFDSRKIGGQKSSLTSQMKKLGVDGRKERVLEALAAEEKLHDFKMAALNEFNTEKENLQLTGATSIDDQTRANMLALAKQAGTTLAPTIGLNSLLTTELNAPKLKTEAKVREELINKENEKLAIITKQREELEDQTDSYKKIKKLISKREQERKEGIQDQEQKILQEEVKAQQDFIAERQKVEPYPQEVMQTGEKVVKQTGQTVENYKKAQVNAESFNQAMGNLGNRLTHLVSVAFLFQRMNRHIRESANIVRELDRAMTSIAVVTNQSISSMWKDFENFNDEARRLSATTREYLEGAKIFYQQGMNTAEVMEMTAATTMSARLAGVSLQQASETLTAAIRSYNMEASQALEVTDKLAAIGANSASNFQELSAAMTRTAAQAAAAGMDFNYMLGILAKGIETTRESAETIGTALKTVIARFQQMKEDPMGNLEDGGNANEVEAALRSVGVQLRDVNGEFRNLDLVFDELGRQWGDLSRTQRAYIATQAAGMRQQSRFMAMMNNYGRTMELVRTAQDSAGVATQQYEIYLNSLEAAQNRATAAKEKFAAATINNDKYLHLYYKNLENLLTIMSELDPVLLGLIGILGAVALSQTIVALKTNLTADAVKTLSIREGFYTGLSGKVVTGNLIKAKSFTALLKSIKAATAGYLKLIAVKAAMIAAVAIKIAVIAGLILGIVALVRHIARYNERLKENTAEAMKNAQESEQQARTYETLINRYEQLSETVNKTAEEEQELLKVKNDLIEMNPQLVRGIDAEGQALLANNDILREQLRLKLELAREDRKEAFDSLYKEHTKSRGGVLREDNLSEDGKRLLEEYGINTKRLKNFNALEFFTEEARFDLARDTGEVFDWLLPYGALQIDMVHAAIEGQNSKELIDNLIGNLQRNHDWIEASEEEIKKVAQIVDSYAKDIQKQLDAVEQTLQAETADTMRALALGKTQYLISRVAEESLDENYSDELQAALRGTAYAATEILLEETKGNFSSEQERFEHMAENFEKRAEEYYSAVLSDLQGKEGEAFLKGLDKLKAEGATVSEIRRKIEEKNLSEGTAALLENMLIGEDDRRIQGRIEAMELRGVELGITPGETLEQFSGSSLELIFSAMDRLEDVDLRDFWNTLKDFENVEELNNILDKVNLGDPISLRHAREELSKLGITSEEISALLVNNFADASVVWERLGAAGDRLRSTLSLLSKQASSGLDFGEGIQLMREHGAEFVSVVGDTFYASGDLIKKQIGESLDEVNSGIEILKENLQERIEMESDKKIREQLEKQLEALERNQQAVINYYTKLKDKSAVSAAATSFSGVINGLRSMAEAWQTASSESLNNFDVISMIANNPALLMAVEEVNGQLKLRPDLIKEAMKVELQQLQLTLTKNLIESQVEKNRLEAIKERTDAEINLLELTRQNIAQIEAMLGSLQNITIGNFFDFGQTQKDSFDAFYAQFDQFFNYIQRIEKIQHEMSMIDLSIELTSDGKKELDFLKEKAKLLNENSDALRSYEERQKQVLELTRSDMKKEFGDYVSFVGDEIKVRWDLIEGQKISNEQKQLEIEAVQQSIDVYTQHLSTYRETTRQTKELTKAQEELRNSIIERVIEFEKQVFDALVENYQKEIDLARKKYDEKKRFEDEYLNHIRKSVEEERRLRDQNRKQEDHEQKKRRLAVLERDTSGMFTMEAEKLRREVDEERQQMMDDAIDEQLRLLEEQINIQQEQRDLQVYLLEEVLNWKQENGIIWEQVEQAIGKGVGHLESLLFSTEEFNNASKNHQEQMKESIVKDSTFINALGKDGTVSQGIENTVIQTRETKNILNNKTTGVSAIGSQIKNLKFKNKKLETDTGFTLPNPVPVKEPEEDGKSFQDGKSFEDMVDQYNRHFRVLIQSGQILAAADAEKLFKKYKGNRVPGFDKGGLVDYTGPAIVHGSKTKPESFLNAHQTEIFAQLRDALTSAGGTGKIPPINSQTNSSSVALGDITVNVSNTNADPQDIGEAVRDEILRTVANNSYTMTKNR